MEIYKDEQGVPALNIFCYYNRVALNNVNKDLIIISLEGKMTRLVADPDRQDFRNVLNTKQINSSAILGWKKS